MDLILVLPIALALAMDAFAVSVGASVSQKGLSGAQIFRLALSFGFFQFMMPVVGGLAGRSVMGVIKTFDHWVAFGLLLFIGTKMIYESFKVMGKRNRPEADQTRGFVLILLSIATSIDALAAGLSFAALEQTVLFPSIIIGVVAFLMTVIGAKIGPLFGRIAGRRAELLGGVILIIIGVKILLDHLE
ncbi:MAG: manganese efflux pump MntP family protein [Candidatus Aminicenantes bacterium]|jgi:putative Mn2+ efflux pump MntP